ncbi:hypothetical protein Goshw_017003 [Gossypium schwendimanii]|uniref:Uncharacterized protein n=1 Tax=Gossypium schwendimanii TaxID=34291 RepID=A0A7J9KLW6_GOSSC|nr:hypothetical protein [Gossypium schwendimanii]
MFIGIIAIGDKAWAPSLGILPSDLFEDDDNATPEENEQNAIDDVLMSDDDWKQNQIEERGKTISKGACLADGNDISGNAVKGEGEKEANSNEDSFRGVTPSRITSSLNPVMDPYGIPQAVKVFDSLSDEVVVAKSTAVVAEEVSDNTPTDVMRLRRERELGFLKFFRF